MPDQKATRSVGRSKCGIPDFVADLLQNLWNQFDSDPGNSMEIAWQSADLDGKQE
jgi:hypothetical protein